MTEEAATAPVIQADLKVEQVPITDIRPYWRNPRINEKAVEVVRLSLERYGFQQPLVVDRNRVIIVGHSRYKAAMQLGYTQLPCVIADLSAQRAKEYRIADNKTAEFASWDLNALVPELREINALSEMEPFFPEYDLQQLMDDVNEAAASVTNADLDRARRNSEDGFADKSEERRAGYVEVVCPHCAGVFYVNRTEIADSQGSHTADGSAPTE
jgi:ParB-like chromosome segregation protein Spo0J